MNEGPPKNDTDAPTLGPHRQGRACGSREQRTLPSLSWDLEGGSPWALLDRAVISRLREQHEIFRLGIRNKRVDRGKRMEASLVGSSVSEGISELKGEYEWKLMTLINQTQTLQDAPALSSFANLS